MKLKFANYVPDRLEVEMEVIDEDGNKSVETFELNEFDDLTHMQQMRFEAMQSRAQEIEKKANKNAGKDITEEEDAEHQELMEEMAVLAIRLPEAEVRAMRNRLQVGLVAAFLMRKQQNDPAAQVLNMQWMLMAQRLYQASPDSLPDLPGPTPVPVSKSGSRKRR